MNGQIKPAVQRTNTKTNGTLVARNYSMSSVSDIELRNKGISFYFLFVLYGASGVQENFLPYLP